MTSKAPLGYVVRLFRQQSPFDRTNAHSDTTLYHTLGHFDFVSLTGFDTAQEMTNISTWMDLDTDSIVDQTIFLSLPRTDADSNGKDFDASRIHPLPHAFMLTFIMVRANTYQHTKLDIFDYAKRLEALLNESFGVAGQEGLRAQVFVTTGASPLGVLITNKNPFDLTAFCAATDCLRRRIRKDVEADKIDLRCHISYTYSVYAFAQNIPADENRTLMAEKPIPCVRFHMIAKLDASHAGDQLANIPDCDVHTPMREFTKALYRSVSGNADAVLSKDGHADMIMGTDDYCLEVHNVSFDRFHKLYDEGGIFCRYIENEAAMPYWYGHYVMEASTSVLFSIESEVPFLDYEKETEAEKKYRINGRESCQAQQTSAQTRGQERIAKARALLEQIGHVAPDYYRFIQRHLHAFLRLKSKEYYGWLFTTYQELVADYVIYACQSILMEHVVDRDDLQFFAELERSLEIMENTSNTMTYAPGYRPAEDYALPRPLIAYTNLINHVAIQWDKALKKRRKGRAPFHCAQVARHRFLLTLDSVSTVTASSYFKHLPPDETLAHIRVPGAIAAQPVLILPHLFHEAGHFFGVRHRVDKQNGSRSREDFFIEMVATRLCGTLYEICVKDLDESNDASRFGLLSIAIALRKPLTDSMKKSYAETKQAYVQSLDQSDRQEQENEADAVRNEMSTREMLGVERSYFDQMTLILETAGKRMLDGALQRMVDLLVDRYIAELEGEGMYPFDQLHNMRKELRTCCNEAIRKMLMREPAQNALIRVMGDVENTLSEVAADVFMLKQLSMFGEDYRLLLFEQVAHMGLMPEALRKRLIGSQLIVRVSTVINAFGKRLPECFEYDLSEFEKMRLRQIAGYWREESTDCQQQDKTIQDLGKGYKVFCEEIRRSIVEDDLYLDKQHIDSTAALHDLLTLRPSYIQYARELIGDPLYKPNAVNAKEAGRETPANLYALSRESMLMDQARQTGPRPRPKNVVDVYRQLYKYLD